jgi:BirA family biotin operon repressor/biotin-[acetyl-CoA-carboxylase] ligase
MPDPLPAEYERPLKTTAARRGPIGARILYFSEIGSTNDEAARLAEHGAPEGTIVLAERQTAGRGRFGRTWYSPPGAGLYMSVVIRDSRAAPFLTLAGGVAVAEGIRTATALPVEITWPNDIVIDAGLGHRRNTEKTQGRGRKVAGLLAEASTGPDGLQHVVLGIGINIRETSYPAEIAERAASLEGELGRDVDRGAILAECLSALARRIRDLAAGDSRGVLSRWGELAPSACGTRVEWDTPSGLQTGITAGLAADGALRVRMGEQVEHVRAGPVRWL